MSRIYCHWFIPRSLPFCRFPLRGVYSPSIQVVTQISNTYTLRSDPRPHRMGMHLSWFALPPILTDVRLLLRVGSIPSTRGWSEILPGVGSVPLTTGRSISGVFFEGFRCGFRSGLPSYYCTFIIFSWKVGIMITPFDLRITQLGLHSNTKLLSGGATMEY